MHFVPKEKHICIVNRKVHLLDEWCVSSAVPTATHHETAVSVSQLHAANECQPVVRLCVDLKSMWVSEQLQQGRYNYKDNSGWLTVTINICHCENRQWGKPLRSAPDSRQLQFVAVSLQLILKECVWLGLGWFELEYIIPDADNGWTQQRYSATRDLVLYIHYSNAKYINISHSPYVYSHGKCDINIFVLPICGWKKFPRLMT